MPQLTPDEITTFLHEPGHLVRVATVDDDGMPRNVPVWYVSDGDRIVFTPRDRSVLFRNVQRDPRVGLTIDEEALPYRKVAVQGVAEILHEPGHDDAWRDLYRSIAGRYIAQQEADAYVDATIDQPRALLGVSLDPTQSRVVTWRMPVAGEDPTGIWHPRYYHDGTAMAERARH